MKRPTESMVHIHNTLEGSCYFNGTPKPSDELIGIIGEQGVDQIQNKLRELTTYEQEIAINNIAEHQGAYHLQLFYELQNRVLISVSQVINNETPEDKHPYYLDILNLPELESLKDTEKYSDELTKMIVFNALKIGTHNEHFVKQLPRKNKLL